MGGRMDASVRPSVPGGCIELSWSPRSQATVVARGREHGGPPARKGMGTEILSMKSEAATFALEFPTDGVTCAITLRAPAG